MAKGNQRDYYEVRCASRPELRNNPVDSPWPWKRSISFNSLLLSMPDLDARLHAPSRDAARVHETDSQVETPAVWCRPHGPTFLRGPLPDANADQMISQRDQAAPLPASSRFPKAVCR